MLDGNIEIYKFIDKPSDIEHSFVLGHSHQFIIL